MNKSQGNIVFEGFAIQGGFHTHLFGDADITIGGVSTSGIIYDGLFTLRPLPISFDISGAFANSSSIDIETPLLSLLSEGHEGTDLFIDLAVYGSIEQIYGFNGFVFIDLELTSKVLEVNESIAEITLEGILLNIEVLQNLLCDFSLDGFSVEGSFFVENLANLDTILGYITLLGNILNGSVGNANLSLGFRVTSLISKANLLYSRIKLDFETLARALPAGLTFNFDLLIDSIEANGSLILEVDDALFRGINIELEAWGVCI